MGKLKEDLNDKESRSGKEAIMMMYSMMPFGRSNGLSNFFDNFDRHFFSGLTRPDLSTFRTDIREDDDRFVLDADLPGFDREDIHLELQGDVLTITAKHEEHKEEQEQEGKYLCRERSTASYSRSFNVSGIRTEDISATYQNGVLSLTLPKQAEQVPESRRIEIQ